MDVIALIRDLITYVFNKIKHDKDCREILEMYNVSLETPKDFPIITMREAYKIPRKFGKYIEYGDDLDPEAERILGRYFKDEYDTDFIFVNEFPWRKRPFYTMRVPEEPDWTRSFDLIYKGLELITGGQREHRYNILIKQLKEKKLHSEPMKWYLDVFKYGVPPHGGFGMGLERLTALILGIKNIKECALFPRDPERLKP